MSCSVLLNNHSLLTWRKQGTG